MSNSPCINCDTIEDIFHLSTDLENVSIINQALEMENVSFNFISPENGETITNNLNDFPQDKLKILDSINETEFNSADNDTFFESLNTQFLDIDEDSFNGRVGYTRLVNIIKF